uniref:Dof-type domain-containing protein n=1 Tax=Oryza rufipogon TaxID=4529 RepID=A0A0E0Q401_ORYRU
MTDDINLLRRQLGWWWRRGDGHEDDSDDEEGGAYDGNGTGEKALVVLVVSSVAASTSSSAAVSGSVPVGLAAKNLKLMHEGAQDLNLAFPQHHGHALQSLEFTAFPSLESSSMCNPGGNLAAVNGAGGRGSMGSLGMSAEYAAARLHLGEFRMPPPRQQQQQQGQTVLDFSQDTHGAGAGGGSGVFGACSAGSQESAVGMLLFPFEDLKPVVSAVAGDTNSGGDHQHDDGKNQGGDGGVIGGHETTGF